MTGYYILKNASQAVISICGEQKYDDNQEYRISDFVIVEKYEDCHLYHSCLTGELLEVTDESKAKQYLVQHWFFVQKNLDEKSMIPRIKKLLRCLRNKHKIGYKTVEIITTTECNAQCYYCYEKLFQTMSMSIETANKVVDFIAKHKYSDNIHIKWYGGEPLMNTPVINVISKGLFDNGISVSSSMISNGYLFKESVINMAKELWHLSNVRITLDGTEKTYNRTKNYKACSGSAFSKVINNIDHLLQQNISVTIRINIEENNQEDVKTLICILCDKYKDNRLLDFMLRPLNNTDANKSIESVGEDRNALLYKISDLKYQIFNIGFDVNCGKLRGMTPCTCIADSENYIVIKPNGELAYCSADFDNKVFGSIFNDSQRIPYPKIGDHLFEKEAICNDCPIYPICSPSKLCPSCAKPICSESQKAYNISDIRLTMKQIYRDYKTSNNKQS